MLFFFEIGRRWLTSCIRFVTDYRKITLGVYALHFLVLSHLNKFLSFESLTIKVMIEFIVAVLVCYVLVKIIKQIPYLRTILIGEN